MSDYRVKLFECYEGVLPALEEVKNYIDQGYTVAAIIQTSNIFQTGEEIRNKGLDELLVPRILCKNIDGSEKHAIDKTLRKFNEKN